jgi:hypothetical protein
VDISEPRLAGLLASVRHVEMALRKARHTLALLLEVVEDAGEKSTRRSYLEEYMQKVYRPISFSATEVAAMRDGIAALEEKLEACRTQHDAIEEAYTSRKKSWLKFLFTPFPPSLTPLRAWREGQVAGNVTPAEGASKEEAELAAIGAAADPAHRTLLMLEIRASKVLAAVHKDAQIVYSGRMLRPRVGSMGPATLPTLFFSPEQRATAAASLDVSPAENRTRAASPPPRPPRFRT